MTRTGRYWLISHSLDEGTKLPFAVIVEFGKEAAFRTRGEFLDVGLAHDIAWWREHLDALLLSTDLTWVLENWRVWLADICCESSARRAEILRRSAARHADLSIEGPLQIKSSTPLQELAQRLHNQFVVGPFLSRCTELVNEIAKVCAARVYRRPSIQPLGADVSMPVDFAVELEADERALRQAKLVLVWLAENDGDIGRSAIERWQLGSWIGSETIQPVILWNAEVPPTEWNSPDPRSHLIPVWAPDALARLLLLAKGEAPPTAS